MDTNPGSSSSIFFFRVGASSPFSQGHPGSVELIEREVKGSFWIGGIHGDGHCMGERSVEDDFTRWEDDGVSRKC